MDKRIKKDQSGKYPSHAPLVYIMEDGGVICAGCANGENGSIARAEKSDCPDDKQWTLSYVDAYLIGEPILCDHCGKEVQSACGPEKQMGSQT